MTLYLVKYFLSGIEVGKMAKQKTRTEIEFAKGKKTLYVWIEVNNKDWLDQEAIRQRRTVAAAIDTILEDCRVRQERERVDMMDSVAP